MTLSDLLAIFLLVTKAVLAIVSVCFVVSGLDDGFVDLYHTVRAIYRRFFVLRHATALSVDRLREKPEQLIAVMLPAWDESAVIGRMLKANLERVQYGNLHIFVGTYPNDPATEREVELVRAHHANVHTVVGPSDGPTSKADCLNSIYRGIGVFEQEHGIRFEMFALNDTEDVIHPLCFKLFNYLVPRLDMVQLPVIPLDVPWWHFTAGHYLDEFAEGHGKEMVVRESLTGVIPGAGVGCAFSRRAFQLACPAGNNELFNSGSLTEDYDFGMRLHSHGLKQAFVRVALEPPERRARPGRRRWGTGASREYIAIGEYFPSEFTAAVRQKARWIVGISLQGWLNLGWRGSLRVKYALMRDRKGLITNPAVALAYCVVLAIVTIWTVQWINPDFYRFPPIVERGSWLWYVILVNTFFLGLRLLQRCRFVWHLHGWRQALLAVPRQVWANIVNVAAAGRALYVFGQSRLTGRSVTWDKTAHRFPADAALTPVRRRLGDLLVDKRLLTGAQRDMALQHQQQRWRPLGAILQDLGLVEEDRIVEAVAEQEHLPVRLVDPYSVSLEMLQRFPRAIALRHSMFPLEDDGNSVVVAAVRPIGTDLRAQLEAALSRRLKICLAVESDVAFALSRGYQRLPPGPLHPLLGEHLVASGFLSREQLDEALRRQRRSYVRLGTLLVELGLISTEVLDETLSSLDFGGRHLGDLLVASGRLAPEQLDDALTVQQRRFLPLGQVLVETGMLSADALDAALGEVSYAD